jgi:hypothetical protein
MNGAEDPGAGAPGGGNGDIDAAPPSVPVPADDRVHLYEAVAARRDGVLKDFDSQRAALIKAVEEQRMAAIPPSLRARARSAAGATAGPAGLGLDAGTLRRPVMQEIALTLRAIIAEEVRTQLASTLAALAETPTPPRE